MDNFFLLIAKCCHSQICVNSGLMKLLSSKMTDSKIEGLHAKRAYIGFLADFHFLLDRANFRQTELF